MTVFRIVRDVIAILAGLCIILWTAAILTIGSKVIHDLRDIQPTAPDPAVTGCPFAPDDCGG
jgi:hypothetical protein